MLKPVLRWVLRHLAGTEGLKGCKLLMGDLCCVSQGLAQAQAQAGHQANVGSNAVLGRVLRVMLHGMGFTILEQHLGYWGQSGMLYCHMRHLF